MKSDQKPTITLEDLLHLKRSEHPSEEFWSQFEGELRAKQLAAIVERRPWWASWERFSRSVARRSLPVGAAAALGVALFSVHEYRERAALSRTGDGVKAPTVALPVQTESAPAETVAVAQAGAFSDQLLAPAEQAPVVAPAAKPETAVTVASSASQAEAPDPFNALVGTPRHTPAQVASLSNSPWNRLGPNAVADEGLAVPASFMARQGQFASLSEPLARMGASVADDGRQAAFLNDPLPRASTVSADFVAPTEARTASHLSDERLYENVRRYGVGGDRLLIRF